MAGRVPVLRQHHVLEALAMLVDERDDLVAPSTARLPPGRKQFCTSTTMSALSGPGLILPCASASETNDGIKDASDMPPAAARNERRDTSCMGLVLATMALRLSPAYDGVGVAGSAMMAMMLVPCRARSGDYP